MPRSTETGLKVTVPADDIERLWEASLDVRSGRMLIVYYDSWDFRLYQRGATCRVRIVPGSAVLTLKAEPSGGGSGDGVFRRLEITEDVRAVFPPGRFLPREIQVRALGIAEIEVALAHRFGIDRLVRLGIMPGIRRTVRLGGATGPLTELDTMHLPDGTTCHEVEVWSDDPGMPGWAATFIGTLCPGARPSQVDKYHRFASAVASLRGTVLPAILA